MNIVFISNYFNHHQKPFSEEMFRLTDGHFTFIATVPMDDERINMGWNPDDAPQYVVKAYEQDVSFIVDMADVVIYGAAPYVYIKKRLKENKLTFVCFERLYKDNRSFLRMPIDFFRNFKLYGRYQNLYCLAASAFTSYDFARTLTFLGKCYKWGYFPETKKYTNIKNILSQKKKDSIIWVGRLIKWKHPEMPILVAKQLKENGYSFELNIIGTGEMLGELREMVDSFGLSGYVNIMGQMIPEKVREYMEQSSIFLFTSDKGEGWGAVLNEAMNSGCAVIASSVIGSVPFLISNHKNGIIYSDGNTMELYNATRYLLDNSDELVKLGENAYHTIIQEWSASIAAMRFLKLCDCILSGDIKKFDCGPCSVAPIIKNKWYKNIS